MMNTKKCSVSGGEYEVGSFSDIVHQYIEASTKEELERVKQEIQKPDRLQQLLMWSEGLLLEFTTHFKERFKIVEINSNNWSLEIDKWNWMGIILGRLEAFKWSEEIYRGLYDFLCDLQLERGRIAKGTPLHQIGWVDLLRGTPQSIERSIYYMKLAMLEDKLEVNENYKTLPAYRVLRGEHNLSEAHLEHIAQAVEVYKQKHMGDPCLRPELIYLEYVINRDNQERSSLFDLDSNLSKQLMDKVKQATTPNDKGSSLEMLLAYLFSISPYFEVFRNIVSTDAQIDLLIRNLHTSDSILFEFGKYIIVECRNIKGKVTAKAIRDFAGKIIQTSCNSGILISREGVTGHTRKKAVRDAKMAILKVHQRHGVVIIPLTIDQIESVIQKRVSLLDSLVFEYERIRFDIS
jgi:hypothetical protein